MHTKVSLGPTFRYRNVTLGENSRYGRLVPWFKARTFPSVCRALPLTRDPSAIQLAGTGEPRFHGFIRSLGVKS